MKNRILFGLALMALTALFIACGEEETITLGDFANIQWIGYSDDHLLKTTDSALVFTNQGGDNPPDKTWQNANLVDVPTDHNFDRTWVGDNNPNMTDKKAYYIVDNEGYIALAVSYTLNEVKTKKILLYEKAYRGLNSFTAR
jgi:hypothetical protein